MSKKKIIFTKHALERASARGVSVEIIKETVNKPSKKEPIKGTTQEFKRDINGRTNCVIVEIKKNTCVIVSTWWENE